MYFKVTIKIQYNKTENPNSLCAWLLLIST